MNRELDKKKNAAKEALLSRKEAHVSTTVKIKFSYIVFPHKGLNIYRVGSKIIRVPAIILMTFLWFASGFLSFYVCCKHSRA